MWTAQTISDKWVAIILTKRRKREEKRLFKKSAPTDNFWLCIGWVLGLHVFSARFALFFPSFSLLTGTQNVECIHEQHENPIGCLPTLFWDRLLDRRTCEWKRRKKIRVEEIKTRAEQSPAMNKKRKRFPMAIYSTIDKFVATPRSLRRAARCF